VFQGGGSDGVDVEVDLYSGRPNPRFRLPPDMADELLRKVTALPAASDATLPLDRLGYRGLRVDARTWSPPAQVVVSAGTVTIRDAGGDVRQLLDRNRDLERWLIDAGSTELDSDLVVMLRAELSR
jgi:hypothetical protein